MNLVERTVEGVQNLRHRALNRLKLAAVIIADRQVHISLCHLCQRGVDIADIFFQLTFGLVNRVHKHSDF